MSLSLIYQVSTSHHPYSRCSQSPIKMAKENKFNYTKSDAPIDIELDSDVIDPEDGNAQDRRDMTRMGKTQELKVCQVSSRLR